MLEPIKFFCNSALPAVYDDSLSYYEVLTKLAAKLNDTIAALNTLSTRIHTVEDNIAQLNQTDVQELADISKLKTSITEN